MKPLQHAQITAHRYGGMWQDWIAFHDWIDRSKMLFPSMQHRMFLHSDFGLWLAVRIFGEFIQSEDGMKISIKNLFRDHQIEDLGRIVTLSEWLRETDASYWTRRLRPPPHLELIKDDPAAGLSVRWGGAPDDYRSLIDFFDRPAEFAPDNTVAAELITHNSFGIFLVEELLGTVIKLTGRSASRPSTQSISTRSAAEDLVYARIGSIPPAGNLAAHTRLRLWMRGAEVRPALKASVHRQLSSYLNNSVRT
jgi:hypothetical protein